MAILLIVIDKVCTYSMHRVRPSSMASRTYPVRQQAQRHWTNNSNLSCFGMTDPTCLTGIEKTHGPHRFFHTKADNTQQSKAIFCTPRISASQVKAVASLNDGTLLSVSGEGDLPPSGIDIFAGPQAGKAFNGVIFNNSITDPFIRARATATTSIMPAAIFRAAQQSPNDLQSTFDSANGFLDLTSLLYVSCDFCTNETLSLNYWHQTRHLSLSATTIYFVDKNVTIPADIESLLPRLVIEYARLLFFNPPTSR